MKIAIVGSRDFARLDLVTAYIEALPMDTVVVSGGARGVDSVAVEAAERRGLVTVTYPADWDAYGKGAGFIRNQLIVDQADKVVAFWDGKSKGTRDTMRKAHNVDKLKVVYLQDVAITGPSAITAVIGA